MKLLALALSLGFGAADRAENIRRAGEVAAFFVRAGVLVITAFISPYQTDRDRIREAHPNLFHEVFLDATAEQFELRDPKGPYPKARVGAIMTFSGILAPYEVPPTTELCIETGPETLDQCLSTLIDYVSAHFSFDAEPHTS